MQTRWIAPFTQIAGLVLLGLAVAHFVGNQGELEEQPADPVFLISTRYLFWALAGAELFVALVCLLGKSRMLANGLLLWLVTNLAVYRVGLLFLGVSSVRAYFATMAANFGLSPVGLSVLSGLVVSLLGSGSAVAVIQLWRAKVQPSDAGMAAASAENA